MKTELNEIEVNGVKYVKKGSTDFQEAEKYNDMPYVIIRTYSAGVHAGYLEKKEVKEVTLRKSRRIHYWSGAASLSQMAIDGVSKPNDCRFALELDKIKLTEAIEILYCTEKARDNIHGVPIWKM